MHSLPPINTWHRHPIRLCGTGTVAPSGVGSTVIPGATWPLTPVAAAHYPDSKVPAHLHLA